MAIIISFGKHKGLNIQDVPEGYLRFMIREGTPQRKEAELELARRHEAENCGDHYQVGQLVPTNHEPGCDCFDCMQGGHIITEEDLDEAPKPMTVQEVRKSLELEATEIIRVHILPSKWSGKPIRDLNESERRLVEGCLNKFDELVAEGQFSLDKIEEGLLNAMVAKAQHLKY
jgi:hypothetical protein